MGRAHRVAVLLGTALLVLASAPAAVADEAAIAHIEPGRGAVQLLVSVPADVEVDLGGVAVTIDGEDTEASASRASGTTSVQRTAVLTMDVSNSMRGDRFASAQVAARTFLASVPEDVRVGIVAFAGDVTSALDPTTDRDLARSVVDGLELGPQTRLYDGVLAAVEMAGTEGQRTLLVLSDGADTSDTELNAVETRVADSGVLLDVVSLDQAGAADAALRRLAAAGDGQLIDADPEALQDAFSREADVLARQVVVRAEVPDSVSGEASIVVTLPTDGEPLTAEAFAKLATAPDKEKSGTASPAPPDPGFVLAGGWMYAGIAALGLGLLALVLLVVPKPARDLTPAERAAAYTDRLVGRRSTGTVRADPEPALTQATQAAGRVLERNRSLEARIALRLEAAGNPLKPAEWLLLHLGVFLGVGMVGVLLGGGSLLLGIVFLALGAVGPWLFLGIQRSRRRKAFSSHLPETLQLMSGSLAAGLSLAQSADTIVREGVEPIASEFRRVLVETRLGIPLEDALEGVAQRFESKDFAWVVMAIRIQRQVGGNLAELLDSVAATMREREYMRRQVAALAAEGKLSAWVLGLLPPLFMLYLLMTNRDYVIVMFTEPLGWMMLGGAGLLLATGVFWMSRLIKVEV